MTVDDSPGKCTSGMDKFGSVVDEMPNVSRLLRTRRFVRKAPSTDVTD